MVLSVRAGSGLVDSTSTHSGGFLSSIMMRPERLAIAYPCSRTASRSAKPLRNYPEVGQPGITNFAADENGVYEIGVRRELIKSGAATLTVRYASGSYPIAIDSLSLGNGGKYIKVNSCTGFSVVFR